MSEAVAQAKEGSDFEKSAFTTFEDVLIEIISNFTDTQLTYAYDVTETNTTENLTSSMLSLTDEGL